MKKIKILAAAAVAVCAMSAVRSGAAAETGSSSTATGISNLMNPAVSLNTLLLGRASRDIKTAEANDIGVQEAELRLSAVVDPFWTADVVFAVHPEHGHQEEDTGEGGPHYALDVEVARAEYRNTPRGLGLKIGKDYLNFGKHLPLHTHNFPFVEAPVGITAFVGDHGLSETGAELAWTTPLPGFTEVKAYATSATAAVFDPESRDLAYGGRLSSVLDTGSTSTVELGLSGLVGPGAAHEGASGGRWRMYGADLTWKWVSGTRSHGPAFNFINEILIPDPEAKEGDPVGFYSIVEYRFHRNWWLGVTGGFARDAQEIYDHGEPAAADEGHLMTIRQFKANLTLAPSEFSAVRLEVRYDEETDGPYRDLGVALQVNFTIGSHPAHLY